MYKVNKIKKNICNMEVCTKLVKVVKIYVICRYVRS